MSKELLQKYIADAEKELAVIAQDFAKASDKTREDFAQDKEADKPSRLLQRVDKEYEEYMRNHYAIQFRQREYSEKLQALLEEDSKNAPQPVDVPLPPEFDSIDTAQEQAQELKINDANQEMFDALSKLGVTPDSLATVLGIEPKAVREKRQKEEREERDRFRQAEDTRVKQEIERVTAEDERRKSVVPLVFSSAPPTVRIAVQEPKRIVIEYDNSKGTAAATIKARVGRTDRPDRLVAAGKVATSTYTTTSKDGFTGQVILVGWVEGAKTIFEHTLK